MQSAEIVIVTLQPSDVKKVDLVTSITDLVNSAYDVAQAGLWHPGSTRVLPDEVRPRIAAGQITVATEQQAIVGCIRLYQVRPEVGEFGMFATDFRYRQQGIGAKLLAEAEKLARDQGYRVMQLEILAPETGQHASHRLLKAWYERRGYHLLNQKSFAEMYPTDGKRLAVPCVLELYSKEL